MNATPTTQRLPDELRNVLALGGLLERLEHSFEPVAPAQYQVVAERLAAALREVPPSPLLHAVLIGNPTLAEVYENVQYEHAGLCLASIDSAAQSELRTRELIRRVSGSEAPAQG